STPGGAGKRLANEFERQGKGADVRVAHRITIHRRDVGARRVDPGDNGGCKHATCRLIQPDRLYPKRQCDRADELDRFIEADHYRCQSPDLPPLFEVTSMPPMTIVRSIALSISNRVRHATETAVNASISTPV